MPSNNNYLLWLQYQTFDVTFLVRPNNNTIGVLLGYGWARGRFGFQLSAANFSLKKRGKGTDQASKCYEFLFELHLIYDDGTIEVINTDKTCKCHKSHILIDNIYYGEYQDMNLYIENWNQFECDENDWKNSNEIKGKHHERLVPRFSVPVVMKSFGKYSEGNLILNL